MYGTLSHSHLLLVLLAWANGANWNVEDEPNLCKLWNPDGSFYNAAVAACDADLERILTDGLLIEVLSWKMLVEEPTAASLISQALNTAHNIAIRTWMRITSDTHRFTVVECQNRESLVSERLWRTWIGCKCERRGALPRSMD